MINSKDQKHSLRPLKTIRIASPEPGQTPCIVRGFCKLYANLCDGHVHGMLDVMADVSVRGLGPDYATVRIMALESLVRLNRSWPGVFVTSGKWIAGVAVEGYGLCPHVSVSSWSDVMNSLNKTYVRLQRQELGEIGCTSWGSQYVGPSGDSLTQYGPATSY